MSSGSNRRDGEQLEGILSETGHWVVNGRGGEALCFAPSLHLAIQRAEGFTARGVDVIALCRLPSDNIIVFAEQIDRLRKIVAEREMPIQSTAGGGLGNSGDVVRPP
jgi:hypothetical protein